MTDRQQEAGARAAMVLAAATAIIGSAGPIAISMGGLAGAYLLAADKSLATAPVTGFNVGVALAALPAAALIRRLGARLGFVAGAAVTALGGAVATLALIVGSFWLFVIGLALVGGGNAFVQKYRFAAADSAPTPLKARAISFVLAGGVVTAILGPQIVIYTRQLFIPYAFAGCFAAIIALAGIGAIALSFLAPGVRLDDHVADADAARPLKEIVRQPRFAAALFCAIAAYAVMSFVMTGAPLAMVGCGYSPDQATLGISLHVLAMFGPSFFTGRLIERFGAEKIVAVGMLLLILCASVALSGVAIWQFWTALVLLGLGWNFGFIGGTAMVATSYSAAEKEKAQGFHDFALFSAVAFASLMSGAVYSAWGWAMLARVIFPVAALCLALLATVAGRERRLAI